MITYSERILADGAIGYWRLDDASGTVAADSAGSNPGTYVVGSTSITYREPGALLDGNTAARFIANGNDASDTGSYATAAIVAPGTTSC
jgi:hypothetical protein